MTKYFDLILDGTLTDTNIPGQNGSGNNGQEVVLHKALR